MLAKCWITVLNKDGSVSSGQHGRINLLEGMWSELGLESGQNFGKWIVEHSSHGGISEYVEERKAQDVEKSESRPNDIMESYFQRG